VRFALKTHDVIHSFWIPGLGGKRDLVNNRTNHLWFTPDSTTEAAFNGFCAEYCGTSHANMRFRAFTVTPDQFASWVAHQASPAVFNPGPPAPGSGPGAAPGAVSPTTQPPAQLGRDARVNPNTNVPGTPTGVSNVQTPVTGPRGANVATGPNANTPAPVQSGFVAFPREQMPNHTIPQTPIPASVAPDTTLVGDATRGFQLVSMGSCIGCHTVNGVPTMRATTGPDLTHVGSRLTFGGGLFPNDTRHLRAWIKNARAMKPGIQMPTMGKGQFDPVAKMTMSVGFSDQQVADIVAYLQSLK